MTTFQEKTRFEYKILKVNKIFKNVWSTEIGQVTDFILTPGKTICRCDINLSAKDSRTMVKNRDSVQNITTTVCVEPLLSTVVELSF